MNNTSIWMAIINDKDTVIFAKACPAKLQAESAILKYLKANKGFNGKDFTEARCWLAEKGLELDLMIFQMGLEQFNGYMVMPPPKENNLFRAVYIIDVYGTDKLEAAQQAWEIMQADDATGPVLTLIDSNGDCSTLDLQDKLEFNKITPGFVTQRFRKSGHGPFKCIWQEFTAGDDVQFENIDGEQIEIPEYTYQPFDMTVDSKNRIPD